MDLHRILLKITRSRCYRGIQMLWVGDLEYRLHRAMQQHLSTLALHQRTFLPYKNVNFGKDVVVVATGPTFSNYKIIPNAIHIGLNRAFMQDRIPLDYLFAIEGGDDCYTRDEMHKMNTYRGDKCVKFYGNLPEYMYEGKHYISEGDAAEARALRFDVDEFPQARGGFSAMTYDLSALPLAVPFCTIFAPIQFALWTNPRRLFLVGCDCSNGGHFYSQGQNPDLQVEKIISVYADVKKFAARYYPQTEIVSVNPVGLRGMFCDWDQESDQWRR